MGISTAAPPVGAPIDDGLTPLDAILATMRWAHAAAEAACAQLPTLAGKDAVDAGRAALALRGLVLMAAKTAMPYVHARLKAVAPKPAGERTHEEWLADMERAAAQVAADESAAEPRAATPDSAAAAPRDPQPGAVSSDARATQGGAAERADTRPARSPPRWRPRRDRHKSWMMY